MTIPSPSGCFDILPLDAKDFWKSSYLWIFIEKILREHATLYGFDEIRTPMFERTELFQRSVGDETDIVSKEMYTFLDRGGRSLSLRPEYTASVIRAFIENKLAQTASTHRFFYIGPMFRYERPQAGRFRQHHQFGVEVIGLAQPELDAEIIEMCYSLYEKLGLKNLTVYVNSLGDKETRERFRDALVDYLKPYFESLSPESKKRFEVNPLRIFDSKAEADREALKNAPSILEFLSQECKDHFQQVTSILEHLKIPFKVNSNLVRGLDYYTKTVFEITSGDLGAQNTVGAGGRYDGLIKDLGGPDLPSIGFATGIERIIQTLIKSEGRLPERASPDVYIIPLGIEALYRTFSLVKELRQNGISCLQGMSGKKLKHEMHEASDSRAKFAIVLGENEIKANVCELKEMSTGTTQKVALNEVLAFLKNAKNSASTGLATKK